MDGESNTVNRSRRSRSRYTPNSTKIKRRRDHDRSSEEKRRKRYKDNSESTECDEQKSRSSRTRTRTERRRYENRKRSRRRKHEHRPSRSMERKKDHQQRSMRHRRSSDRSVSRNEDHQQGSTRCCRSSGRSVSTTGGRQQEPTHCRGSADRDISSKNVVSGPAPENEQVNKSVFANSETQLFLTELLKSLSNIKPDGNKFPMLGNVIPEFDPMFKGQTINMWLNKVEECAKLYRWGDDQIIHYALPKLTGIARSWYQALPSISFSWPEWKIKLLDTFPSSDDYAELLTEMLAKRAKYNDSLELYFYEKVNLLNRCEIFGKRAVDCLLYGIEDRSLRLGAKAAKCQEPEEVLNYFQSIKQQIRETDKSKVSLDKKIYPPSNQNIKQFNDNDTKTSKTSTNSPVVCYNCNEPGHFSFWCTKKILKCNICKKLGHLSVNCPRLPNETKKESVDA